MILGPGEGHAHYSARGSEMFFKATAELDGGDLSLMERTLPPGGRRPQAHRHTNCSEAYFVLDGLVSIIVEGEELTVGREGFVLVPRGTAHTFGNTSAEPARLLVIHTPPWTATSPACTSSGTVPGHRRRTRNARSCPASAWTPRRRADHDRQ